MADPWQAAAEALSNPIGSPDLQTLAAGAKFVSIAVTDATRACPDELLVTPMLRELERAGIEDDAITFVVAVGTHRPSSDAERREKLGSAIVDRFRIIDHNASSETELVEISGEGLERSIRINRTIMSSDLVIATGRVEPHQYAGFSGGGKTVAIGCADEGMIAYTHGPAFLDQKGTRLGQIDGNPFQELVRVVAERAKVRFVANCVIDDNDRLVAVAYGDPFAVQDALAEVARPLYLVPIPSQVDIAVAGVGYPKDQNLYQASRAASYLHFAPTSVVRNRGVIIVPAACPEGAGEGVGERRFRDAMIASESPSALIARARREGIAPGEQRAYVMSRVLEDVAVLFVGLDDPTEAEAMGFLTAPDMPAAWEAALSIVGDRPVTAAVVPHALLTLPVVQSGSGVSAAVS
jgi:lactate racemase